MVRVWMVLGVLHTNFGLALPATVPPQVSVLFDDRGTLRELIVDAGERRMVDGAVFLPDWQGRSSWP